VWRQQNSARWYDNPLIAQDCIMLSPECMDLLNMMFNLDSDKRCVRGAGVTVGWGWWEGVVSVEGIVV
jgi:hypothetical protein